MKRLFFLDHSYYDVEEPYCRGCFMEQNAEKLPVHINPIYDDKKIVIRQDAEWPIPAFYIISIHEHIGAFDKLDTETRTKVAEALYWVRKGIRENFRIERAQIYHEEKISSPHFHIWVLPLWKDVMEKFNIQPKIYESNVREYIGLFDFEKNKQKILQCNQIMRQYLNEHMERS